MNEPFPEHSKDCELGDNWKDCPCCQLTLALYNHHLTQEPSKIKGKRLPSRKELKMNDKEKHKFVRRLSVRVQPASIDLLAMLIEADHSGRSPLPGGRPESVNEIVSISKELKIQSSVPVPIVKGRHLLEIGFEPGPDMGVMLKLAYDAQLEGVFETLEDGLSFIRVENTLYNWPIV